MLLFCFVWVHNELDCLRVLWSCWGDFSSSFNIVVGETNLNLLSMSNLSVMCLNIQFITGSLNSDVQVKSLP